MALLSSFLAAQEDPKHMFLRAREMQRANGGNDSAGAIALYKKVIAAIPNSAEAHLRLSEALLEVQDINGALAAAKKAAELAPKNAEAATNLAILEFTIAKQPGQSADAAKAALIKAAKLSPGDPELWFRLADICESTQDAPGALNAWLRLGYLRPPALMGDQPVYIVAYDRAAYLAHALNRYSERREACLALAREANASEQHLRMLEELARYQVDKGYLGHAEESFALLAKRLPEEPVVWQNIALVQRRTGRFADAVKSLQRAHEIMPEQRNVVQQAFCLMNMGNLQEAYEILQDLCSAPDSLASDEHSEYVRGLLSACALMLNRPDDLLKAMESWSGASENIFLSSQRAQALIKAGDLSAARGALKEGMERFPEQLIFKRAATIPKNVFEGRLNQGGASRKAFQLIDLEASAYLFAEFRQWDRCLETIQEIHSVSPIQDVDLLLLQSNVLESLSHREEALNILRRCQRLAPGHSVVQNNLGYYLLDTGGDIQEASSLIRAALDQEPDNASYQDSWGWALFKQGKFKEAEAALQSAVEANPISPEIRKHLGEALLKLDRPQEAIEQWESALAFAFPEREKLEDRIKKLKTDIAKKALAEIEPDEDAESDEEDGSDDDEWQP
jgi:tetratricopeptide (TPR) repeat protein